MKVRAIVVDIDGTLTDKNKIIFTKGIEALRLVQDKGTSVSIASGNVLPVAYGLSTYIGLKGPIIAENGGIVSWKERIYQLFDGDVPLKAYEHLANNMDLERLFTDHWRRTEVALKRTSDLDKVKELLSGWDLCIEATGFAIHIMSPGHGKRRGLEKYRSSSVSMSMR